MSKNDPRLLLERVDRFRFTPDEDESRPMTPPPQKRTVEIRKQAMAVHVNAISLTPILASKPALRNAFLPFTTQALKVLSVDDARDYLVSKLTSSMQLPKSGRIAR